MWLVWGAEPERAAGEIRAWTDARVAAARATVASAPAGRARVVAARGVLGSQMEAAVRGVIPYVIGGAVSRLLLLRLMPAHAADVEASLSAKLIEAASGATMWADSASVVTSVAHAAFNSHGDGHFGARDADGAYSAMIDGLAYQITDDFRVHFVTRRVSKEEYERSVSAEGH